MVQFLNTQIDIFMDKDAHEFQNIIDHSEQKQIETYQEKIKNTKDMIEINAVHKTVHHMRLGSPRLRSPNFRSPLPCPPVQLARQLLTKSAPTHAYDPPL